MTRLLRNNEKRRICLLISMLLFYLMIAGCQTGTDKAGTVSDKTGLVSDNNAASASADVYQGLIKHYQAQGLKFGDEAADAKDSSLLSTTAPGSDGRPAVIIQRQASDQSIYYCMISSTIEKKDDLKWVLTELVPAWKDGAGWIDKYAQAGKPKITMIEYEQADIYLAAGGNTADSENLATLMVYPAGEKKN